MRLVPEEKARLIFKALNPYYQGEIDRVNAAKEFGMSTVEFKEFIDALTHLLNTHIFTEQQRLER